MFLSEEMGVSRENAGGLDSGTNFAEILSNVLPPHSLDKNKEKSSDSSVSQNLFLKRFVLLSVCVFFQNGSSEVSESASTSSVGSNSSHSKAPGAQLTHKPIPFPRPSAIGTLELTKQLLSIDNDASLGKTFSICEVLVVY